MSKKTDKNLENRKTPPLPFQGSVDTKVSEKKQANHEPENAFRSISHIQKKFSTHIDATRYEKKSDLPKETVPDQSLTVKEIMKRFASGLPLSVNNQKSYDDDGTQGDFNDFDNYMPNLASLDLADRQEILELAKLHLDDVKTKLNAMATAKEDARKKELKALQKQIDDLKTTQSGQSTQSGDPLS